MVPVSSEFFVALMEGARDGDVAVFQQLQHDLGHVAPDEFRQFVKEHDTFTALIGLEKLTKTDPLLKRQMQTIDFMVVPTGFEPVFPA